MDILLFIQPSPYRCTLGCFQSFSSIENTTVNTHFCIFACESMIYIPRNGIARSEGKCIYSFSVYAKFSLIGLCHFAYLPVVDKIGRHIPNRTIFKSAIECFMKG